MHAVRNTALANKLMCTALCFVLWALLLHILYAMYCCMFLCHKCCCSYVVCILCTTKCLLWTLLLHNIILKLFVVSTVPFFHGHCCFIWCMLCNAMCFVDTTASYLVYYVLTFYLYVLIFYLYVLYWWYYSNSFTTFSLSVTLQFSFYNNIPLYLGHIVHYLYLWARSLINVFIIELV